MIRVLTRDAAIAVNVKMEIGNVIRGAANLIVGLSRGQSHMSPPLQIVLGVNSANKLQRKLAHLVSFTAAGAWLAPNNVQVVLLWMNRFVTPFVV